MSIKSNIKKGFLNGFTLAEVLTTLGIIGVVAAFTIPTLINNQQNRKELAAIKVAYAKISDGFIYMRSEENVDDIRNTTTFHGIDFDNFETPEAQEQIDTNMKKYFNIIKSYKAGESCSECPTYITMDGAAAAGGQYDYAWKGFTNDGMTYYLHIRGPRDGNGQGKIKAIATYFYVDINGTQGPNKWGKDMFQFAVAQNGIMYAPQGQEHAESMDDVLYWGNNASGCGTASNKDVSNSSGYACTARIIESGWDIDYR